MKMKKRKQLSIEELLEEFSRNKNDFQFFCSFYGEKFEEYDNDVYEDFQVRILHLKYFLEKSWWNNRFYFLWKDYKNYEQIVDIGFSVPYLPVYLFENKTLDSLPKMLYVDGNDTSKKLAEFVLSELGVSAEFVVGDIQNVSTWRLMEKKMEKEKYLFCSFETIEHLSNPEIFWENLKTYQGSTILLSLPIGPKIPSHHLFFQNKKDVDDYLQKYVKVEENKIFDGKPHGSVYKIYTTRCRIL
jgi:hypothetical protein